MGYSALTKVGEDFIKQVCNGTGTKLLSGNNGRMPYTYPIINKVWTSHALLPPDYKKEIENGNELANALIYWYNYYGKLFELDANILAAQAYIESHYNIWIYVGYVKGQKQQSTAMGLNQFLMRTAYDIILNNGGRKYNTEHPFTPEEMAKITKGFPYDNKTIYDINSYYVGGNTETPAIGYEIAWNIRPYMQQNVIDNPDIMIKAQCSYIKHIGSLCNYLTSSTLFGYNDGPKKGESYSNVISTASANGKNDISEALDYVLKIFGVLGDQHNLLASQGKVGRGYKPRGFYFGYDAQYFPDVNGKPDPKNLRLFEPYSAFNANLG